MDKKRKKERKKERKRVFVFVRVCGSWIVIYGTVRWSDGAMREKHASEQGISKQTDKQTNKQISKVKTNR